MGTAKEVAVARLCRETPFLFLSGYAGKTILDHKAGRSRKTFPAEALHAEAAVLEDSRRLRLGKACSG